MRFNPISGQLELSPPASSDGGGADGGASLPAGLISAYAGESAPSGWLFCDGSQVSRTTYATLFAAIGTIYGVGDASSTFNLPDLTGRVPTGLGVGSSAFAGLGVAVGEETHVLNTDEMPTHTHGLPFGQAGSSVQLGSDAQFMSPPSGPTVTDGAGGGTAHNNIQPSLTVNYIIKT